MEDNRQPGIHVRLSPAMIEVIDQAAEREGMGNRSGTIRAMLAESLIRRGVWPPTKEVPTA